MYAQDRFERVHDFINFCERKPADEEYDFRDCHTCACGQFFGGDLNWFALDNKIYANTGISLNNLACGDVGERGWKFGPLAKRARAAIAEQQQFDKTQAKYDEAAIIEGLVKERDKQLEEAF